MKPLCHHHTHGGNEHQGIFRCPFCNIRQNITMPSFPENGIGLTSQQFSNRWGSILFNTCSKCHRPMVLEKIVDNQRHTIMDVYQWINNEMHRFKSMEKVDL